LTKNENIKDNRLNLKKTYSRTTQNQSFEIICYSEKQRELQLLTFALLV